MDHRKIQTTGNKTFIVSLPKDWANRNSVKRGDFIGVLDRGDKLLLMLEDTKGKGVEIKIDKHEDPEFVKRLLITRYIQGYSTVIVTSKNRITSNIRSRLKDLTKSLIGLEPFGDGPNEMTFRMLMKEQGDILDLISRMHDMSTFTIEEIIKEVGKGKNYDKDALDEIILRESEIDKFYFLILRQLSSYSEHNVIPLLRIVDRIEIISDHMEEIAQFMLDGGNVSTEFLPILNKTLELYRDTMLSLRSGNTKLANEVIENVRKLRGKGIDVADKKTLNIADKKTINQTLIYNNLRHTVRHLSGMAKSVINLF